MNDVVLYINDLRSLSSSSSSTMRMCRICHEEEFGSCKNLEAPCSCSGTLKFAHRECIQRWCNEKGNTTCEICLRKFEPGYTSAVKKTQLFDATVTIRVSLQVPRSEPHQENTQENLEEDYPGCFSATDRIACWCRLIALIFTTLLLIKHLFAVVVGGPGNYPFSLHTILIAKASGILIPVYILIKIITAIRNSLRYHYQNDVVDMPSTSDNEDEDLA